MAAPVGTNDPDGATVLESVRKTMPSTSVARKVSFDDELLILVDAEDNVTGYESKVNAHQGEGLLHRAFSIFLFNPAGEVLLHRRGQEKALWPGYWTNSCCSHPRKGESYAQAAARRLDDELGVSARLRYLYQFQYSAAFGDEGGENELCAVFAGVLEDAQSLAPNPNEIAECRWLSCEALDHWVQREPEAFTPWFKLEWDRLRTDQRDALRRACRQGLH
jgi:isopentenyl-diphosphate delta-isomerase